MPYHRMSYQMTEINTNLRGRLLFFRLSTNVTHNHRRNQNNKEYCCSRECADQSPIHRLLWRDNCTKIVTTILKSISDVTRVDELDTLDPEMDYTNFPRACLKRLRQVMRYV